MKKRLIDWEALCKSSVCRWRGREEWVNSELINEPIMCHHQHHGCAPPRPVSPGNCPEFPGGQVMEIKPKIIDGEPICNCTVGACPFLKREKRLISPDFAICTKTDEMVHWAAPCIPALRADRDKWKKQCHETREFLVMACECLSDYGDADYDMMTQGGNQGLRHIISALACLESENTVVSKMKTSDSGEGGNMTDNPKRLPRYTSESAGCWPHYGGDWCKSKGVTALETELAESRTENERLKKRVAELEKYESAIPSNCPITGREFFCLMATDEEGKHWVPTYGGPFDSYTIPQTINPHTQDGYLVAELYQERYDHDEGGWVDGGEATGLVVAQECLIKEPK